MNDGDAQLHEKGSGTMSFPVPVLYKALRRIELAGKSGLTAKELAEYMDMGKSRSLIAELYEQKLIHLSTAQVLPDSRITITSSGTKALLEYGLQIPDETEEELKVRPRRVIGRRPRKRRIWPWVVGIIAVLLLCFASMVFGAYHAWETDTLIWLKEMIVTPVPAY